MVSDETVSARTTRVAKSSALTAPRATESCELPPPWNMSAAKLSRVVCVLWSCAALVCSVSTARASLAPATASRAATSLLCPVAAFSLAWASASAIWAAGSCAAVACQAW